MGVVTLTRGVGFRDDLITISQFSLESGVALTTDGDQATLSGTTASNGATETLTALNTTTYPYLMIRAMSLDGLSRSLSILMTYTSGSDTFVITLTASYAVFIRSLTAGKTL